MILFTGALHYYADKSDIQMTLLEVLKNHLAAGSSYKIKRVFLELR